MTLNDFATFSTAVSGLAVTASLIYLAMQTHQNSKHTRALILQGRIARAADTQLAAASHDIASAIIIANGDEPTPENIKRAQFRAFCVARFQGWQDTFSQHQKGLLDEDMVAQMRDALVKCLSRPGYRAEWEEYNRVPGTKFTVYVDNIIDTLRPVGADQPRQTVS